MTSDLVYEKRQKSQFSLKLSAKKKAGESQRKEERGA